MSGGATGGFPRAPMVDHGCDPGQDAASDCAWTGWIPVVPGEGDDDGEPGDSSDPVVITMRDVAQFQPAASELIIEPNGWGIVHRPVNVFTDADVHTTTGTVLGQPVTIDWIPVSFTVDYGDGTRLTYTNPGESWSESEAWATTETSHVYTETGDYIVSASVEYMAIVHVGGNPVPVDGTIDVDTGSEAISIYWVKTRIVRGDCIEYPLDPGCEIP